MRGNEDNQFGALFTVRLRTKYPADIGNPVQHRNSRHCAAGGFLDLAADGDGVAVLHRHLRGDRLCRKRRRVNTASRALWGGGSRRTYVLADHHGYDSAGRDASYDIQSDAGAYVRNAGGHRSKRADGGADCVGTVEPTLMEAAILSVAMTEGEEIILELPSVSINDTMPERARLLPTKVAAERLTPPVTGAAASPPNNEAAVVVMAEGPVAAVPPESDCNAAETSLENVWVRSME